ncbi:TRAP transporter small permease subunit [Desertibaculum subflavum]|uniref:TRAP transporter small permease subunit n=1 Tax=Desertibaculum subflavum TaxID=2268458 RepID=UPI000E672308
MTGTAAEAGPPTSLVGRLSLLYSRLENALNLAAAVAIFALMIIGVIQIVGRTLFNLGIYGYVDWIEQFAVIYAILGIAYCQRYGSHIRMEIVLTLLRGRVLWALEAFGVIVGLILVGLLIDTSWDHFMRAWTRGDSSMDIRLPVWPAKLIVPIALTTLWLRLLLQLLGYLRMFADPSRVPEAVPVVETPEELARHEIEDALGRNLPPNDPSRVI